MSNPTYSATCFLEEETNFNIDLAVESLAKPVGRIFSSNPSVEKISPKHLRLTIRGWNLDVAVWDVEGTLEENAEMFPADPNNERLVTIAKCPRRVHAWTKDADPEMEHFNDYMIAVEILCASFMGFHAVDDASGEWY